jgi:hypothetical protein
MHNKWQRCLALLGLSLAVSVAHAASVSYNLDQTNANPALADDVNYLQVTISDATLGADTEAIRFDVTALGSLTGEADDNFGIQAFGFNAAGDVSGSIAGLPTGWSVDTDRNMSAFGRYDIQVSGTGGTRQDPTLTFYITGVSGDALADYALASEGNAGEGNQFFAAHVAGFMDQDPGPGEVTSAFFAGPESAAPIPLPATMFPFVAAIAVAATRLRRRLPRG